MGIKMLLTLFADRNKDDGDERHPSFLSGVEWHVFGAISRFYSNVFLTNTPHEGF